jgi:hypothetical protein
VAVVEASVLVDALVNAGRPGELARAELRGRTVLEVPAIFAAEATSALRGLVRCGSLSTLRAATALEQIRTVRWSSPHRPDAELTLPVGPSGAPRTPPGTGTPGSYGDAAYCTS